jgi:hypothetical protein
LSRSICHVRHMELGIVIIVFASYVVYRPIQTAVYK